jgi:Putative DNA-binding domain
MKLAPLQLCFQSHLLGDDSGIEHEIRGDAKFPVGLRLGVYTGAYVSRLVEVLAETFPAVQAALGTRSFARLAGEFVRQHPSRFRSARAYGAELPAWLGGRFNGARARGIADLARFEWTVAAAFDAADQSTLTPDSLIAVAPAQWPRLQFEFSPTLQRLRLASNAVAWWKFACDGQPRPRWRATAVQEWLVWRQELAVFYRRLPTAEGQALDAARAGCAFAELCEPLGAAPAATLLHGWFSAGLIIGTRLAP